MLDYNSRPKFADKVNAAVDATLTADNAARPPRDYLGGSRLGHACERALQFEFTHAPKDEGQDFSGQLLRIFAIGHLLEDLAVAWLRGAGFDLYTRKGNRPDGGQFGLSYDFPWLLGQKGATVRHAIYGGQWRWLDRKQLGLSGPLRSMINRRLHHRA